MDGKRYGSFLIFLLIVNAFFGCVMQPVAKPAVQVALPNAETVALKEEVGEIQTQVAALQHDLEQLKSELRRTSNEFHERFMRDKLAPSRKMTDKDAIELFSLLTDRVVALEHRIQELGPSKIASPEE